MCASVAGRPAPRAGGSAPVLRHRVVSVAPVSTQLLFSTVRIEATTSDGKESIGTAFFFDFFLPGKQEVVTMLVTNKHVVENTITGKFLFHEATDASGDTPSGITAAVTIEDGFADAWIPHPATDVDLCFMPVFGISKAMADNGRQLFYRSLRADDVPSASALEELRGIEDVTMIGYPCGLWDDVHNMPIARRGITASHPALRFRGQPIGVADIAAFPGSSGSPVVILNEGAYTSQTGLVLGHRILLLGVMFAWAPYTAQSEVEIIDIPTEQDTGLFTAIPMHLSFYVRSSEILDVAPMIMECLRAGWQAPVKFQVAMHAKRAAP